MNVSVGKEFTDYNNAMLSAVWEFLVQNKVLYINTRVVPVQDRHEI